MELSAPQLELLADYLEPFLALAGDQRTRTLLGAVVAGIIGSGHLLCSRIAAFSPSARRHAGQ